jgi:hypothetical protein
VNDHAFSQKPSGSAAVSLRPAARRVFPPPFTKSELKSPKSVQGIKNELLKAFEKDIYTGRAKAFVLPH